MSHCEDWMEETLTGSGVILTFQECSRLLKVMSEAKHHEFFRAWVHIHQQEEYLAYDITSISSYSKLNEEVELGYNRDKEKLPQINLGMYFGETTKLPVYYRTYYGSIPDKSHLVAMMESSDYGFHGQVHLLYSDEKMADEKYRFKTEFKKWQASIAKGLIPREAEPFFHITKDKEDAVLSVEANHEVIDAYMQTMGYFLVMSTDFQKSTADILEIYR